jgi:predicted HNH restriction endonuclease
MYTIKNPPPLEKYIEAFAALLDSLTETDKRILAIQYARPQYRMSSQQLRDALGYAGIAASNGVYGKLASKLAEQLDFDTGDLNSNPKQCRKDRWRAVATSDDSGESRVWILRPAVVAALEHHHLVDSEFTVMHPVLDVDIPMDTQSAVEGRKRLVLHLDRERNPAIVKQKKKAAASLACEICGFSFAQTYGDTMRDVCEVHHLLPLSAIDEQQETTLADLMIVCANCHRVIHRQCPPYTPEEVRRMLAQATKQPDSLRTSTSA